MRTRTATLTNVQRVAVPSDHYALLFTVKLHGYWNAGTPTLTVAWVNMGNNKGATHRILSILRAAGAEAIFLCEARDRWTGPTRITAWTDEAGWACYRGDRTVTSHETAVLLAPHLRYTGFTHLAAKATTDMGPGAGPRTPDGRHPDTARYLLRTRITFPRAPRKPKRLPYRRVKANGIAVHLRPSWTWSPPRLHATQPQIDTLERITQDLGLPTFIPGDWNGEWPAITRRLGYTPDSHGPRIPTKGPWAPDAIALIQPKPKP